MTNNYILRPLTREDMPAAAHVMRLSFDDRLPHLAGLHTPAEDVAFFTDHLFARAVIWGAWDAELLGIMAIGDGWIKQFYVRPDSQGRGIGRALLDLAKAQSPRLQLWTFQQNAGARRFYGRNGFVAVEVTDGAGNEARAPDVRYVWPAPGRGPAG